MSHVAVGILCGRGETDEALQVIARVNADRCVETILPLFPNAPAICQGKYLFFPPAADNRRGAARNALVRRLAMLQNVDYAVILDDDTCPDPGYFERISKMGTTPEPYLMSGKLLNTDGNRSWDLCAFDGKDPIVIPYVFAENESWAGSLYFSGPQHIFNRAGLALAAKVGYSDLTYGEDTVFCRAFKAAGGKLKFLPDIQARLLHQHKPPNEKIIWK